VNIKSKIQKKILLFFIFSFFICFASYAGKEFNSEKSHNFEVFKNKFEQLCFVHLKLSTVDGEKTVGRLIEEIAENPNNVEAEINLNFLNFFLFSMVFKINSVPASETEKTEIDNLKVGFFNFVNSLNYETLHPNF